MELLIAFILGIVEGITEFLPISSTGHLIVVGNLLGFTGSRATTFEVFIQLGAILAVVVAYRQRFLDLISHSRETNQRGLSGFNGLKLLFLTTLPALLTGLLLHGFIKEELFNPAVVAVGLLFGGIALIAIERWYKPTSEVGLDKLTTKRALMIGGFQVLALSPGVSRSGATIVGGRLSGLSRAAAVEYSFLAAVPVMLAAVSYDMYKNLPLLQLSDIAIFAVGFITAFISALIAIKVFVRLVQRYTLEPFGWYRIALALVIFLTLVV